jgi:CelD/BcsL family acetyltransferase involved in cellulose biosynthesis
VLRAYLAAFGPRARVLLVTARIAGRLRAVLPLVEERRSLAGVPIRVLRGAANVHSGRFDLVRGPGIEGDAATAAVWRFLKADSRWDAMRFEYVPSDAALEPLLAAAAREGFHTEREEVWRTPYIALGGGAGTECRWLEGTDAKFRANLRRRLRKLSSRGSVTLRRVDQADPAVLQRIYDVERSGWKGREGSAIASNGNTRQFYDEIAREAARFGYLSLYLLELDGRAVAVHFGLAHRGRYFLPKPAYDESYREYSPGQLLMQAILTDCVERGQHEVDFLGPMTEWKAEWTSQVRVHSSRHVFRQRWGRALHTAMRRVNRAKALTRLLPSSDL